MPNKYVVYRWVGRTGAGGSSTMHGSRPAFGAQFVRAGPFEEQAAAGASGGPMGHCGVKRWPELAPLGQGVLVSACAHTRNKNFRAALTQRER